MMYASANTIPASQRGLVSFIRVTLADERVVYGEMLIWAFIKRIGMKHCNGCSAKQISDMFWTYLCAYEGESDF